VLVYVAPNRWEKVLQIATGNIVTVNQVKIAARMDLLDTAMDSLIESYILSAQAAIEAYIGGTLLKTRFRGFYDGIPYVMRINKKPNLMVEQVKIFDVPVDSTLYEIQKRKNLTNIFLSKISFPDEVDSVVVDITCGYESAALVPEQIKAAIIMCVVKMLTGDCGDNNIITKGAKDLLKLYRDETEWSEIT